MKLLVNVSQAKEFLDALDFQGIQKIELDPCYFSVDGKPVFEVLPDFDCTNDSTIMITPTNPITNIC